MLRPILDVSNLNVVLSVAGSQNPKVRVLSSEANCQAGAFSLIFGFLSLKLKQKWYIGEACSWPMDYHSIKAVADNPQYRLSSWVSFWDQWAQSSLLQINGEMEKQARAAK